jgi:hypothetical protein
VGLIARAIEAEGVPTLCMTSALSITRSVWPPRAAFVDFPLGHTTGRPHDPDGQRALLRAALAGFASIREPGGVIDLGVAWAEDDAWKDDVMRPRRGRDAGADEPAFEDDRTPRHPTPQYQTEADRTLAEAALAEGGCETCVFLEDR